LARPSIVAVDSIGCGAPKPAVISRAHCRGHFLLPVYFFTPTMNDGGIPGPFGALAGRLSLCRYFQRSAPPQPSACRCVTEFEKTIILSPQRDNGIPRAVHYLHAGAVSVCVEKY
jgi:hypothetical protein